MTIDTSKAAQTLKKLRVQSGLSVRATADAIGRSASSYAHYENEFKKEFLPGDLIKALLPIFVPRGIDPQELAGLTGPNAGEPAPETDATHAEKVIPLASHKNHLPSFGARDLPVYGAALGGTGVIMLNRGEHIDTVSRPGLLIGVKDAFAVVIASDSMEPMFMQGDIAHVHPGRPPAPNRGVLIETHDGHADIKAFISQDDNVIRCRQYNPPKELRYKRADVKRLYRVVGSAEYG